jgi:NAD(P)-dependent dehydrogenase (short-subunit alcohol dehydrogenase family)
MNKLFDLTGRCVFVVGGAGYLGTPVCEALAGQGAKVVVADFREDAAESVAEAINQSGGPGSAEARALDISDEASINRQIASVDGLDGLVNLAASSKGGTLDDMSVEDWDAGLRTTLTGAWLLSRAAAKRFGPDGGVIVHFSSMYGQVSPDPQMYTDLFPPNPPDYGVAKAGISQLTRYQAVAWASRNIRVNAVVPGPFPKTFGQGANPEFVKRLSERVPLGRVGRPEEIAGAVVYLCSDAASYTTGTSLVVDGGWTAW